MKKIISILIILILVSGCSTNGTNENSVNLPTISDNNNSDVFGELNISRRLNNLQIKFSTYWQFMDSYIYNDDMKEYEYWHIAYITDYGLKLFCGYVADENKKTISDADQNDGYDETIAMLTDKGYAYSYIDSIDIDGSYGYMFDISNNGVSYRAYFLNDNGGYYVFELSNGGDLLPSIGLDFMYDYIHTIEFIKQ